jgi:hypothetical protein
MQRLPKDISQEAHENMGLYTILGLMPDRTYSQVTFVNAKRGLSICQLNVRMPKIFG